MDALQRFKQGKQIKKIKVRKGKFMEKGFVTLHRSILDWEWYDDINVCRLFIHCILKANHKNTRWRGIDLKRGDFLTSYEKLGKQTGLTVMQVRTCLKRLKSTSSLTIKTTNKYTIISIVNYDDYQDNNNQTTIKQQSNNNQITTDNNDNNDNNDNKIYTPIKESVDLYNDFADKFGLSKVQRITSSRSAKLKKRLKEVGGIEGWKTALEIAGRSDFLLGRKSDWKMNFDFLLQESSFTKLLEGSYNNQQKKEPENDIKQQTNTLLDKIRSGEFS